jgi:CHAT domain-containing protein/tetratricopeptide (TPR) repeat protein
VDLAVDQPWTAYTLFHIQRVCEVGWVSLFYGLAFAIALPLAAAPARAPAGSALHSRTPVAPADIMTLRVRMAELQRGGQAREALAVGREALRLAQQTLGAGHQDVARISCQLAKASVDVMDYRAAVDYAEAAVRIFRTASDRKPGDWVMALYVLGTAETRLGRLPEAETHLKEACGMCVSSDGSYDENSGLIWQSLGDLYFKMGRYGEAEHHLLIGLHILDKNRKASVLLFAQALDAVGVFFMNMGDANRAEPYLVRNLQTLQENLPAGDPRLADALDALARMNRLLGEYDRARHCIEDSLHIRRQQAASYPLGLSLSLQLLASVSASRGDLTSAYATQVEALSLIQDRPGTPAGALCTALNNLGWYALGLSRLDEADARLRRALAIAQETAGGDSEDVANTTTSLAIVAGLRKDMPAALQLARTAHDIYQRRLAEAMRMGSEDQKQAFVRKIEGKTHFAVELHLAHAPDDAGAAELALGTILLRKGLVVEAVSAHMAEIRQDADVRTQAILQTLAGQRSALAHMALAPDKRLDREEARQVWCLMRDMDQNVRAIQRRTARQDIHPPEIHAVVDRVRRALPPKSALIEYVTYKRSNPALSAAQRERQPTECAAYVLLPDGRSYGVPLAGMSVVAPRVHAFRRAVANPGSPDAGSLARDVAAAILDPVLERLKGVETLFVAPDELLHLVPFGVLPDRDGRMLLERMEVVYLNTGRDLIVPHRAAVSPRAPTVLAAPDFDAGPAPDAAGRVGAASGCGMFFGPLPGTAKEQESILRIMPDARKASGAQATEAWLKSVRNPAVLHIATHGFFLDERGAPEGEARGLKKAAPSRPSPPSGMQSLDFQAYRHPYLRSGLALAGANCFAGGGEDGILTALEVADLDLRGTALVVLSACETGLGEAVSGAGVFGLRRAFQEAGARTQVLSLWKVHDEATAEIMRLFYEELRRGAGKAAALRTAQLTLRKERPEWQHPFYWGAMIVSGERGPCREPWGNTGAKP